MFSTRFFLMLSLLVLTGVTSAFADVDRWFAEGQIDRGGVCISYKILAFQASHGNPPVSTWYYRIFEGNCDGSCMEEVYYGPLSLYGGDVPVPPAGGSGSLPITVTQSGTGYVNVAAGNGGTFQSGGSSYPTCDAVYTSNGSSVLVIAASLLN